MNVVYLYSDAGTFKENFSVSTSIIETNNLNVICLFSKYKYSKNSSLIELVGIIKGISLIKNIEELIIICDNQSVIDAINFNNNFKEFKLKRKLLNLRNFIPDNTTGIHCTSEQSVQIKLCDRLCNYIKRNKINSESNSLNVSNDIKAYLSRSKEFKKFTNYKIIIL